ncbi:uncharacterized protein HMPREF1541_03694 [Cyphellophora europaea CBS 101466]|uniref:Ams2/SPT21 N-terminal domain-containing protein n=1 Tax=Cyphellophora europaea (strain CBS 101466) TaxID=1220924 RepID=W2RZ77_CYPE1|nr:uncharacterized protein HMPREF1541_03694 [Cyphellophora europaea CBS 101466]ETN41757.1 hypothetical protein HMPREF1541_03694 [Cyphellophora europaea CBS 101466]
MASPDASSVQTVKLKVLYTFDVDSKDNHLTRWPQSIQVNTCFLDNVSQIGVVDLRTCLEAIVTASPELTSQVEMDYAVYAYDYSEDDTPLVGQGLLSKNIGEEDMEQENEAMITGRITKGLMGLLNKNAQPTLEVKLRLKPVATAVQRQRSGSVSSQDGRPSWLQNPEVALQRSASPMDTSGIENMQRMISEGGPPRDRDGYAHSRPGSRAGTPGVQQSYDQSQRQLADEYSRPSSRSAMRQPPQARRDSFSGYYSADETIEEGHARKRAKITKVNAPNKGSFNIEQQPDGLRAIAGKASSVRLHRPTPVHPPGLLNNVFSNEEPVRPPTPVPSTKATRPRGRPRKNAPSTLSAAPSVQAIQQKVDYSESAVLSPDDHRTRSVSSTPANIPSSPPVMPQQLLPRTSPVLPPMHTGSVDSGFGSGNMDDDIFGENGMVQFDDFDFNKAADVNLDLDFGQFDNQQYPPLFAGKTQIPEVQQVPTDNHHDIAQGYEPPASRAFLPPPSRPIERSQSFTPVTRPQTSMSSPKLAPAPYPRARQITEEQQKTLPKLVTRELAPIPASDPGTRKIERSQTWAPDSDALMSEALAGPDGFHNNMSRSKKRPGKEQTKARLENAIASGAMPPYCDNCGCIETPAWRRGYAKVFDCPYDDIETGLGSGDIVYKHPLTNHEDGAIKTFRGYKTDKRPEDESNGWKQICLCNPCGLWFHKQKCPRPKEKWQKAPKGKRKRNGKGPKAAKKPNAPPNPRSDAPTPASDDSSPADTDALDYDNDEDMQDMQGGEDEATEPQLPPMPRDTRASSADPPAQGLRRATKAAQEQRQIQSSPTKGGRSEADPIDVDLTPKPLRRQLFPSPDKAPSAPGSGHGSGSNPRNGALLPSFVRRSPRLTRTKDVFQISGIAGAVALTADGKENIMPELAVEHSSMSIDDLFEANGDASLLPPSTPQRRSERLLSKTPQQGFGAEVSANIQRTPNLRTPRHKQAQHPLTAALLGTAVKDVTEMTPFSRSIQDALNGAFVTPGKDKGSRKSTPHKGVSFDFPDLPSLKGSSPFSNDMPFNIAFSELPTDIQTDMTMFSTDGPIPSSPPNYLHFIDPKGNGEHISDEWSHMEEQTAKTSSYPDPTELGIAPTGTPRRSPRNNNK